MAGPTPTPIVLVEPTEEEMKGQGQVASAPAGVKEVQLTEGDDLETAWLSFLAQQERSGVLLPEEVDALSTRRALADVAARYEGLRNAYPRFFGPWPFMGFLNAYIAPALRDAPAGTTPEKLLPRAMEIANDLVSMDVGQPAQPSRIEAEALTKRVEGANKAAMAPLPKDTYVPSPGEERVKQIGETSERMQAEDALMRQGGLVKVFGEAYSGFPGYAATGGGRWVTQEAVDAVDQARQAKIIAKTRDIGNKQAYEAGQDYLDRLMKKQAADAEMRRRNQLYGQAAGTRLNQAGVEQAQEIADAEWARWRKNPMSAYGNTPEEAARNMGLSEALTGGGKAAYEQADLAQNVKSLFGESRLRSEVPTTSIGAGYETKVGSQFGGGLNPVEISQRLQAQRDPWAQFRAANEPLAQLFPKEFEEFYNQRAYEIGGGKRNASDYPIGESFDMPFKDVLTKRLAQQWGPIKVGRSTWRF